MFLWNLIWLNVLKRLIRAACRLAFHKTASSGFSMSKKPGAPNQYSDALCLTSKLHRCGTSPATRFGRCRQSAWALLLRTCTPGVCCARNSVRPGPKRQRCRPPCNTKKKGGSKRSVTGVTGDRCPTWPPFPWKTACLFKVVFIHLIPEIK